MKTLRASEFKAKCLAVLDEVAETGAEYTIVKRGKPVARLTPPAPAGARHPQDTLAGTVRVLADIVAPAAPAEDWEANATTGAHTARARHVRR